MTQWSRQIPETMKSDRELWRTAYSLYDGAVKRLGTMEPAQVWQWFFDAAEQSLEKHEHAPLLTDLIISVHSEIERLLEAAKEG